MACTVLLSACASWFSGGTPAAKEQPQLEIQVEAGSLINPDDSSRPSPLLVRIYELRNETLFQDADFFSLYNADKTILQGDMLMVDQFILRPGEARTLRRKSHPQATVIGVLAAYRDLPNATWRALYKLPAPREVSWYSYVMRDQKVRLRVELQSKVASITDLGTGASSEPAANIPSRTAPAPGTERNTGAANAPSASSAPSAPSAPSGAKAPALPSKEEVLEGGKSLGDALKSFTTK